MFRVGIAGGGQLIFDGGKGVRLEADEFLIELLAGAVKHGCDVGWARFLLCHELDLDEGGVILKVCGRSVETLDTYEAEVIGRPAEELGPHPSSALEAVEVALTRLERLDPVRAGKYRLQARDFVRSSIPVEKLPPPPSIVGLKSVPLPRGCRLEQLTLKKGAVLPGEKSLLLRRARWKSLNKLTQASVILHSLAEAELNGLGVEASARHRQWTQVLSGSGLAALTLEEYFKVWKALGTESATYTLDGLELKMCTFKFAEDGDFKSATVGAESTWKTKDVQGFERSGTLGSAAEVIFWKNAHLKRAEFLKLDHAAPSGLGNLSEPPNRLTLAGPTEFYESGELRTSVLAEDLQLQVGLCTVPFQTGTAILIGSSGRLESVSLPPASPVRWEFCSASGEKTVFRKNYREEKPSFDFYENGQVKEALLDKDTTYPFFDGNIAFSKAAPISFFANGRVKRGMLKAESITLTTVDGKRVTYLMRPTLTFSEDGKVVGEF